MIEILNYHTPRMPGKYRDLLDEFVRYHRERLDRAGPANGTIKIDVVSQKNSWTVTAGDEVSTVPKTAGSDLVLYLLASGCQSHEISSFDCGDSLDPARTIQKRLKRVREKLLDCNAAALAQYIRASITISNKQQTISYTPKMGYQITTAVLQRS